MEEEELSNTIMEFFKLQAKLDDSKQIKERMSILIHTIKKELLNFFPEPDTFNKNSTRYPFIENFILPAESHFNIFLYHYIKCFQRHNKNDVRTGIRADSEIFYEILIKQ